MLSKIRESKPLIHHITNWVSIYDCAQVTLSVGALPVMAHAIEEVEDMVSISSALVLNIGTLTPELIEAMIKAGKTANRHRIPVILDAVGAGATPLRTNSTLRLLKEVKISVLKGNKSEIGTIAGVEAEVRGVEAMRLKGNITEIVYNMAKKLKLVVIATGEKDVVSNGKECYVVSNGHPLLGAIVGSGCMLTSILASFVAIEKDVLNACVGGLVTFGIAGEKAALRAKGPASFKERLYDVLYNLDESELVKGMRVSKIVVK